MMDYAIEDTESLVMQNVLPRTGQKKIAQLIRLFRQPLWRTLLPRGAQWGHGAQWGQVFRYHTKTLHFDPHIRAHLLQCTFQ